MRDGRRTARRYRACNGGPSGQVQTGRNGTSAPTADRERTGREASPTAAVLDAQAVRSGGVGVAGVRGYDAAKRVIGRKRHALVDADGRLLLAAVSPASLHDSHGGIALLSISRHAWPFLALCFADRAYAGSRVANATPVAVQLVGRAPDAQGFAVQPRR
jgi:putative transposase